ERGIFQFRPLRARDDRLGELLIVEQVADALLLAAQEAIHLRHVLDMDASGSDQGERGQAGGVAHRPIRGEPTAKRTPDEMDAGEAELIEKIEIEVGEIADGIEPRRRIGGAEARMLGNDDVELFRQLGHAWEPDAHAAAAMKKEQRRPRPAAHEADAAVADRNGRVVMRGVVPQVSPPGKMGAGVRYFPPRNGAAKPNIVPRAGFGPPLQARDAVEAWLHVSRGTQCTRQLE